MPGTNWTKPSPKTRLACKVTTVFDEKTFQSMQTFLEESNKDARKKGKTEISISDLVRHAISFYLQGEPRADGRPQP